MSKNKNLKQNHLSSIYLFKNLIIFIIIYPILSNYSIDIQVKIENNKCPIINFKYIGKPSLIYMNNKIMDNNDYIYENDDYLYIIKNDIPSIPSIVNITLVWNEIKNVDNEIILLYNPESEENIESDEIVLSQYSTLLEFSDSTDILDIKESTNLLELNESTNYIDDAKIDDNIFRNKSKLLNGNEMFKNCSNLILINLKKFNTSLFAIASHMFDSCTKLEKIYDLNIEYVEDISYLFYNCVNLKAITPLNFNFNDVKNMEFMYYNCNKLNNIKISINTYNVLNMKSIFMN